MTDGEPVVRQRSSSGTEQLEPGVGDGPSSGRRARRLPEPVPTAPSGANGEPDGDALDGLIHRVSRVPLVPLVASVGLASWWLARVGEVRGEGWATTVAIVVAWLLTLGAAQLLVVVARRGAAATAEAVQLRRLAWVDDLTGLANRSGVTEEIDRRLARRRPGEIVGVLFCDLDRLAVVNDSLGHAAGDEVVSVAARRLSSVVRDSDVIGRFGGDQFVVVSAGLPAIRDLEILAGRLTEVLSQPTVLADGSAQVISGSIGIALVAGGAGADGGGEATSAELLRDAEVAMHQAKRAGGGRHAVFEWAHRAEAVARLELEQELRVALREGQIVVHHQPIIDTSTGLVDRVEALIRWEHPVRGTVLPSEFLAVAAESQLIVELGRIVLTEACRQAVAWSRGHGRPITAAVNVSERQLLDLGLVDTVTRALAETGLPAGQLELEVSEELILERVDRSLVVLRQLDLLGVELAIDDFGTSQASLSRLKQLAMVSTLKIDRLFVADIDRDPVDARIVAAIVALAASVGMSVVAEGVETPAQARVLVDLGVEHLQGFLFHRPAPASVVGPSLAEDHRSRW